MRNINCNGYETITVVRSSYAPRIGQCLTISPVFWIYEKPNKKENQYYFVVAPNNCINYIHELKDIPEPDLLKLITQCGTVSPNENNEIDIIGECGIRALADDCPDFCINLLTGYGLKGGGQICKGETRTIELDVEITGDVRSEGNPQIGDIPKYKEADSKVIVPSNINSVDGLTKITKSTKGEQKLLVETTDTESGSNAGVEAKSTGSGTPYFQLTQGNQTWNIRCNPDNNGLEFRPVNDLSKPSMLTLFPNGTMIRPYQPKAAAYFTKTPNFPPNQAYTIGSNQKITILRDNDGYNLSANNFYAGDGAGQGAYYITPYSGKFYEVGYQFLIDCTNSGATGIIYYVQIVYGDFILYNRGKIPKDSTYNTAVGFGNLPESIAGQKIEFKVVVEGGDPYLNSFVNFPSIDNYIQIYMKD